MPLSRAVPQLDAGDRVDLIRSLAWTTDTAGQRKLAPEGLCDRRTMTAVARSSLPAAPPGSVDRGMRLLGLSRAP